MTKRPSPALIISLVALFVALGGTALAARGLISGSKLKNRSVAGVKLKKHTLTGNEINLHLLGTVPSAAIALQSSRASNATNATHASSADNATHASGADNATHASSADSANSFGGLSPNQYSHADTYAGTQTAPMGTLSTPALAPGAYLLIAHASVQDTAGVSEVINCVLTGPSGGATDQATLSESAGQTVEFPLIVSDTSATSAPAVLSCNSPSVSLSAQISVIRLGSESHGGTLTPGS